MGDINNINWVESQNTFSKSSRKIFGRNIYYNYFKDHQKKRYEIGRFRHSIDGGITILKVDKELNNDGLDSMVKHIIGIIFIILAVLKKTWTMIKILN